MVTVCHPVDEMEQMFIVASLEAAEIPYFVKGYYFGSLYPGMVVPWYNERTICVPRNYIEEASEIVLDLRSKYELQVENISIYSKLRMLLEGIILSWVMPYGKKR